MNKVLGLALAAVCLTGCSDDDTSKKPTVSLDQLNKKWYYASSWINDTNVPYEGNEPCGKDYLEFQASNVAREVDYFDCQQDPATTTGTYTVDDDSKKLTVTLDGETINYTIIKLNSKELEAQTNFNGKIITDVFTSVP